MVCGGMQLKMLSVFCLFFKIETMSQHEKTSPFVPFCTMKKLFSENLGLLFYFLSLPCSSAIFYVHATWKKTICELP